MTSGGGVHYKSMFDAGSQIIAKEGVKSLFKGAGANILRGVAGAGVLSLYDKMQQVMFGKVYSGGMLLFWFSGFGPSQFFSRLWLNSVLFLSTLALASALQALSLDSFRITYSLLLCLCCLWRPTRNKGLSISCNKISLDWALSLACVISICVKSGRTVARTVARQYLLEMLFRPLRSWVRGHFQWNHRDIHYCVVSISYVRLWIDKRLLG